MKVLHLVLTHHWYDEIKSGSKRVEYRDNTSFWRKRILGKQPMLTHVRFARGYTSETQTFEIDRIDLGPCPYPEWAGEYIRIHFS